MEDVELRQKLEEMEKKMDAVFRSAERTRKYIMWTGIVSLALIVLPAIGLLFAIPSFINTYTSTYSQIGGL